ncbi:MAG: hypothetical protein RR992_06865 [Clostridiales bacterium]
MKIENVFKKIEQYLNGKISAEDFSYDFPVTYSLHAKTLDAENPELSLLLENELKALCKRFDPNDFYNIAEEKCFSEADFKKEVTSIYQRAKALL